MNYIDPTGHAELDPVERGGGTGSGSGFRGFGQVVQPVAQTVGDRYVTVYAFRGFGKRTDTAWERVEATEDHYDPLLKNGHVGIQLEKDGPIYGFTPDIPGSATWSKADWDEWQDALEPGWSEPGSVKNDTKVFAQASRVSKKAGLVTDDEQDYMLGDVYAKSYRVTSQQYALISDALLTPKSGTYAFPHPKSPPGCVNCGQFVYEIMANAGVTNLPPSTGRMRQYMVEFIYGHGAKLVR